MCRGARACTEGLRDQSPPRPHRWIEVRHQRRLWTGVLLWEMHPRWALPGRLVPGKEASAEHPWDYPTQRCADASDGWCGGDENGSGESRKRGSRMETAGEARNLKQQR